jgi:hypothetical protein
MKLRCVLIRHRWRQLRNDDGERYSQCGRCGQILFPLPPGAKNISAMM